ncbi:hypothetical protein pipiens_014803 [Culex pipiens pipiens]|uniref:Uncharacterized protein n=1 Tax=Culex pipiens pipiens TaxID=38569 RepID=A0ABD1CT26_CULPP
MEATERENNEGRSHDRKHARRPVRPVPPPGSGNGGLHDTACNLGEGSHSTSCRSLRGSNTGLRKPEALAVAKAAGLDFIRAEGYVFGHVADEGYTDANAGLVLRYRKAIDAERVLVLTDIKKKHSSHSITEDVSLVETAKAAEFFISDGLILTGSSTGSETSVEEVQSLRNKTRLPLIIGSGVTVENIDRYWNAADAAIVGSHFKDGGSWQNELRGSRVNALMKKLAEIRN